MRVGMGYDVHRLAEGRKLILGGVEIPHTLGLLGHSDADVAVHAIMDALLGAAALGDIGKHFPDTDEAYAGISSLKLLAHVGDLLMQEHYFIENIDATIVAQKPKLRPYIDEMEQNVAQTLHIQKNQVNIKATTEERLGFTGIEKGIAAYAACALSSIYEGSYAMADSQGDSSGSFMESPVGGPMKTSGAGPMESHVEGCCKKGAGCAGCPMHQPDHRLGKEPV